MCWCIKHNVCFSFRKYEVPLFTSDINHFKILILILIGNSKQILRSLAVESLSIWVSVAEQSVTKCTHRDRSDLLSPCSAAPHCCVRTEPQWAWPAAPSVSEAPDCSARRPSRRSPWPSVETAASAWTRRSPLWPELPPAQNLTEERIYIGQRRKNTNRC